MSRDDAFRAQTLLFTAEGALADAALSQTFFEACRGSPHGRERWEQRRAREQELRARVSAKYESRLVDVPESERWAALLPMRDTIESEAKLLGWQEGDVPESYERRYPSFTHEGFFSRSIPWPICSELWQGVVGGASHQNPTTSLSPVEADQWARFVAGDVAARQAAEIDAAARP